LFGESLVEGALLPDQLLARRHRFRFHGVDELLNALALWIAQLKLIGKLQHMHRSRISVELTRERKSHAAAGAEIGYCCSLSALISRCCKSE
jgi:hypothetical protein